MTIRPTILLALSLAAGFAFLLDTMHGSGVQQPHSTRRPAAAVHPSKFEMGLPVIVLGRRGVLVPNLTAKDFTLTDDGRTQKIERLSTQSPLPYRLGLLVDTSPRVYRAIAGERKAAGTFIDRMLPTAAKTGEQDNQAFLIHFDREVELLEDFTAVCAQLHRELDEMTPTSAESGSASAETGGDMSRRDAQLYDAIYLASRELMQAQRGRKALVVFSDGADRGSKETQNDAVDAADRANVQIFTIYFKGETERSTKSASNGGRSGGWGGIGLPNSGGGWPGGEEGKRGGAPKSETGVDGRKIMQQIAWRTGGVYFEAKSAEDLDRIYGKIATLLRQQYLLTYAPDKIGSDPGFRKIVLKVDKRNAKVYTCEGYYAPVR